MIQFGTAIRFEIVGFALFMMVLAGSAQAEGYAQAEDYAKAGPYAGIGFALGFQNFDDDDIPSYDPSYGFNAWGGYRFSPHFAGELMLEYFNGFKVQDVSPDVTFQGLNLTGNVKGYLLTGRWQPFALIGIGMLWQEALVDGTGIVDSTDFAARFGGGLDYYVTEQIALGINAAYVLPTNDLEGLDYISLIFGAQYKF